MAAVNLTVVNFDTKTMGTDFSFVLLFNGCRRPAKSSDQIKEKGKKKSKIDSGGEQGII